jgi:hypothetical protein
MWKLKNLVIGILLLFCSFIFWGSGTLSGQLSKINLFLGLANIVCFINKRSSV